MDYKGAKLISVFICTITFLLVLTGTKMETLYGLFGLLAGMSIYWWKIFDMYSKGEIKQK